MRAFQKSVFIAVLVLGGCGGGSGGVAVAPGGTATSTPTPTPTPISTGTPGFNSTLADLRFTQQFAGYYSSLFYDRNSAGLVTSIGGYPATAAYDPIYDAGLCSWYFLFNSTHVPGYPLVVVGSPPTANPQFAPRDRVTSPTAGFTLWRSTQNGASFKLSMLTPGPGNPQLGLQYSSFGVAHGVGASNGLEMNDTRAYGFGIPSELLSIPKSGTATYSGLLAGEAAGENNAHVYALSGRITLVVDYGAQTFSGSAQINGTDLTTGTSVSFAPVPISQPTARLDTLIGYVGTGREGIRGFLAGPAAEEVYGSFQLLADDPASPGSRVNLTVGFAGKR